MALRMGSCLSSNGWSSLPDPSSPSSPMSVVKRPHKAVSRRRSGLRSSSFEQLHRIPGRMFPNGASSVALLFTQQGRKGTNQDAMIVWENFGLRAGEALRRFFPRTKSAPSLLGSYRVLKKKRVEGLRRFFMCCSRGRRRRSRSGSRRRGGE